MRCLYQKWLDVSVKLKTSFLMGAVFLTMLIIAFIGSIQMESFTAQSEEIMNEYREISGFIEAFSAENMALEEYMRPISSMSAMRDYQTAIEKTDLLLKALHPSKADPQDKYALKRAIYNAMIYYRSSQSSIWGERKDTAARIDHYLLLKTQATYIDGYARQLLDVSMDYGSSQWNQIEVNNRRATQQFIALMLLGFLFLVLMAFILNHNVLNPLKTLSRAATMISDGCYDAPPILIRGKNELGQTAHSFNLMQTQVRKTIRALEKQAGIEKQLLEKEVEAEQMRRRLQEGRFAQLQSQINPHFLFNTLNTIAAMAREENAPLSEDLILRLSHFFRYSLGDDERQVTLGQEIQLLRDYMELQETRYGERITMEVVSAPELEGVIVPKFILQPLVENAIIHGLNGRSSGGLIRVRTFWSHNRVTITVSDNGCGFDPHQLHEPKEGQRSVGLSNIIERVEMMRGSVSVFSRKELGTSIRIQLEERKQDDQNTCSRG